MEIRYQGSLTRDEYFQLTKLLSRPKQGGPIIDLWILLAVGGALLTLGSLWSLITSGQGQAPIVAFVGLPFGIALLMFGMSMGQQVYRTWDSYPALQQPQEGVITDSEIELRTGYSQSHFPWTDLDGWGEYRDVLIVNIRTEAIPFSRRFFESDADWHQFRTMVRDRLPVTHEVRGFSLKGLIAPKGPPLRWIFIYLLIIISITIIVAAMLKER